MSTPIHHVNAFTDRWFAGNPAAVCLLAEPREPAWMQGVAAQMNLSETAFLVERGDGGFDLRWFTPAIEVDLCGHATLASAHVLWGEGRLAAGRQAVFHTCSGRLTASQSGDLIELDFPALPAQPAAAPPGLAEALGTEPVAVARGARDWLVELGSERAVRELKPDFGKLRALGLFVIATAAGPGAGRHDFVSRFFAPSGGVDEDPVTGSAHCVLGPWWSKKLGRRALVGYQASRRGGEVRVTVAGDRVLLGGRAVTVLRGELADEPAPAPARAATRA